MILLSEFAFLDFDPFIIPVSSNLVSALNYGRTMVRQHNF
jgi:hypothetical protein